MLLEAAQGRFPLPGLAHSQPDGPFVLAAPLGGSLLVMGTAATAGAALAALVLLPAVRRRVLAGVAAAAVAGLPLAAGAALATSTTPAGTVDAAVVQGGGPRGTRAVFTDPDDVTDRQLAVLDGVTGSPDLVVLPEGVVVVDAPLAATARSRELAAAPPPSAPP